MKVAAFILLFLFLLSLPATTQTNTGIAQKKINLDDVQIKGETQNKGLSVLSRSKNSLDGRITLRTSYKNEILAELPASYSSAATPTK